MMYLVWTHDVETIDFLIGLADTEEIANKIIEVAKAAHGGTWEYVIVPIEKNQITINGTKHMFES